MAWKLISTFLFILWNAIFNFCRAPNASNSNCDDVVNASSVVKNMCDNQTTCSVAVNHTVLGDPCREIHKTLWLNYTCEARESK